ncbi:MAG: hypothetical protein ACK4HK_14520 [Pannonibacter indicus]|jgi:hypothetical protein|uniref:hypothetical protein n=1 Tax=Pannonibacter indicus TaxID=466044 RepID=UPI0014289C3E|nr:hypothetical protein [Pannonibacter indicus]
MESSETGAGMPAPVFVLTGSCPPLPVFSTVIYDPAWYCHLAEEETAPYPCAGDGFACPQREDGQFFFQV